MSRATRITLLGTGSSGGVPRANGDWGDCDPANPKNRRRRCSVLVEGAASLADLEAGSAVTRLVIDTSPDFREQMLSACVPRLDGVLFTHDHADQTHGIDDLRAFAYLQRERIPVWLDEATDSTLSRRFGYTFETPPGSGYPPILDKRAMPASGEALTVTGPGGPVEIIPITQRHGRIHSLGFRIGALAYSPDINELPDSSRPLLDGVQCWIVDALREEPHPTHFCLSETLDEIDRAGVSLGVLTNMHITLDHARLSAQLPAHVHAGYDGLQITCVARELRLEP
ncbi:MBL fold metallo-hydrolase [Maricaulis parjimensis]|uniref:MBL fold metallo-hydrolase n=1 Tax=Maricaulis parjimensis TaxID=144023 RepID=UPI001939D478|nr:MBL fold metallo-hydrolase [Maricaulis parjimensis]